MQKKKQTESRLPDDLQVFTNVRIKRMHNTALFTLQVSKHSNCFCVCYINVSFTFLQGGICTLYIPDEDKVVSVASEHLEPQVPQKGDRVRSQVFFGV